MRSIWENVPAPKFTPLERDISTDFLIIGGGMAGLLSAYRLTQAGIDNTVVEADRVLSGNTRCTTAKITAQQGQIYSRTAARYGIQAADMYYRANMAAIVKYAELAKQFPCDFMYSDAYLYSVAADSRLMSEYQTLLRIGADVTLTKPQHLPMTVDYALKMRDQACFHPLKLGYGIAQGLNIFEKTRVIRIQNGAAITDKGYKIHAKKVIVATHFPVFNRYGYYFLKMVQNRSYTIAIRQAPDVQGMYLGTDGGMSLRNVGDVLLVCGGSHKTGSASQGFAPIESWIRKYCPDAVEVTRFAAQDCMTPDDLPYIGRYSNLTPDLYVATGFNKWGMSGSMIAADILCDMIQGKINPCTALFDPNRKNDKKVLLQHMLSSAYHLLIPTRPRCPHMGCALKYNRYEHSWDCPCHGSRYRHDGTLIDGPAKKDMKKAP